MARAIMLETMILTDWKQHVKQYRNTIGHFRIRGYQFPSQIRIIGIISVIHNR